MKRVLAILLVMCLIVSFTFLLGGCGRKGECDECGRLDTLKTIKFDGDEYHLCKDCYTVMKRLMDLVNIFD